MNWECDNQIDAIVKTAKENLNNYIDMLYIQSLSRVNARYTGTNKKLTEEIIDSYLIRRGYTMNYVSGKRVMVKGFTCVYVQLDQVEIWHDKSSDNDSVFVKHSLLTGLPLTLDYMERI